MRLLRPITRRWSNFLEGRTLIISVKDQLDPSAAVTWIGKTFDLHAKGLRNTRCTISKSPAVVVQSGVSRLTLKRVERVTSRLHGFLDHGAGLSSRNLNFFLLGTAITDSPQRPFLPWPISANHGIIMVLPQYGPPKKAGVMPRGVH